MMSPERGVSGRNKKALKKKIKENHSGVCVYAKGYRSPLTEPPMAKTGTTGAMK